MRATLSVRARSHFRAGHPAGEYVLPDQARNVDWLTCAGPHYCLQVSMYRQYMKFPCSKAGGDKNLSGRSGDTSLEKALRLLSTIALDSVGARSLCFLLHRV